MLFISFSLDLLKDPNFKDMKKHLCLLIQRIGKLPIITANLFCCPFNKVMILAARLQVKAHGYHLLPMYYVQQLFVAFARFSRLHLYISYTHACRFK